MLLQLMRNCEQNFENFFMRSQRHDCQYWASFSVNNSIAISHRTAQFTFRACNTVLSIKFTWLSLINDLQMFLSNVYLYFMSYIQLLYLRLIDNQDCENILIRDKQYWFSILCTDKKYWLDLSSKPIFVSIKKMKLIHQIRLLLSLLLWIFNDESHLQFSNHNQLSDRFSSLQNLILICEAFQILINLSNSLRMIDWTELSWDLSLSKLSEKLNIIDSETMQKRWAKLSLHLSINSSLNYLMSRLRFSELNKH